MKWVQVIEYLIRRCFRARWEPHWPSDRMTAVSGHMTAQSYVWAHLFRIWTSEVWLADSETAKVLTCIELPVHLLKDWNSVQSRINVCSNFDDCILEGGWEVALDSSTKYWTLDMKMTLLYSQTTFGHPASSRRLCPMVTVKFSCTRSLVINTEGTIWHNSRTGHVYGQRTILPP